MAESYVSDDFSDEEITSPELIDDKIPSSEKTLAIMRNAQNIDKRKKMYEEAMRIENKAEIERKEKELIEKTMIEFYKYIEDKIRDASIKEETYTYVYIHKSFICNKCYYQKYDKKRDYMHKCHYSQVHDYYEERDVSYFKPYKFIRRQVAKRFKAFVSFDFFTARDDKDFDSHFFNNYGHKSNKVDYSYTSEHIKLNINWAVGYSILSEKIESFDCSPVTHQFHDIDFEILLEQLIANATEWESCITLSSFTYYPRGYDPSTYYCRGYSDAKYMGYLINYLLKKFKIYCKHLDGYRIVFKWDKTSELKFQNLLAWVEDQDRKAEEKRKKKECFCLIM